MASFSLLISLDRAEAPSIGDVSALLAMDRTTLTANLKPLERRGLVKVTVDEEDKRCRRLRSTPAGRALLVEAVPLSKRHRRRPRASSPVRPRSCAKFSAPFPDGYFLRRLGRLPLASVTLTRKPLRGLRHVQRELGPDRGAMAHLPMGLHHRRPSRSLCSQRQLLKDVWLSFLPSTKDQHYYARQWFGRINLSVVGRAGKD